MNRWSSATPWATCAATLCLLAACSGQSNDVAPVSFDDPPASVATTTAPTTTVAPQSSVAASTTTAAATTTTSALAEGDALTGPTFSDALGIRVDTAPGVRTRGDTRQLTPDGLYVHIAWEPDPDDPSVFTVQHDDIDILEAYTNAVATYYRAATTTLTIDAPEFARFYLDRGAKFSDGFQQATVGNFILDLGAGVVLRPYVLADQRTADSAVVMDCYLEDQEYVDVGATREPGLLKPNPSVATLVQNGDGWVVDKIAVADQACL